MDLWSPGGIRAGDSVPQGEESELCYLQNMDPTLQRPPLTGCPERRSAQGLS